MEGWIKQNREGLMFTRLGVSHELEEDDVYDGYFLPKGTRVHPVEW